MLWKISISNECCTFELSIHKKQITFSNCIKATILKIVISIFEQQINILNDYAGLCTLKKGIIAAVMYIKIEKHFLQ